MTTIKKNACSLRELKASEKVKKKSFFSFFNTQPKIHENNSSVKLKGIYPKIDNELAIDTISASVSKPSQMSESDIYEEIHIECSESENESVKNLSPMKSHDSKMQNYNRESSDEEDEEEDDDKIEEDDFMESTKRIHNEEQMKTIQVNQNNQPQKGPLIIHYEALKLKNTDEKPTSLTNRANNNYVKETHQENKLKFESMLKDLKEENGGKFRARSKSLHPNFNPVNSDQHVKFDERRSSTSVSK